jgi:hypothetical protein
MPAAWSEAWRPRGGAHRDLRSPERGLKPTLERSLEQSLERSLDRRTAKKQALGKACIGFDGKPAKSPRGEEFTDLLGGKGGVSR